MASTGSRSHGPRGSHTSTWSQWLQSLQSLQSLQPSPRCPQWPQWPRWLPSSARAALIAAVTALALTGCGGGDAPGAMPAQRAASSLPVSTTAADCDFPRGGDGPPVVADSHPRILLNHAATLACLQQRLAMGQAPALRFRDMVDAQVAGEADWYNFQPWHAALLYRVTGEARYAEYAIAQTDAFVASEEALVAAGQAASVAGDSYLEVGDKVGNVAIVYDWCHDRLTPSQRDRWLAYAHQAVANVWNPEGATWGGASFPWSGWSVDNPSNNYYYSFLRATMLLGLASSGEHPQAQAWLTRFRTDKIEHQLLPTFNRDLEGGGSREGTGYGTAMRALWQLYDWWERSTGERLATRTPHTLASMAHLMHDIVPTLDRLAPVGDQARDATAMLFDYHREYLLGLIALFPQERLSGVAKGLLEASSVRAMTQPFEYWIDYLYAPPPSLATVPLAALATTYWGAGTGQLMMRADWGRAAAFSHFICGAYTESHAHHDQGSFMIFRDEWLAIDQNLTMDSGIEQEEEQHNGVRLFHDGDTVPQVEGAPPCRLLALTAHPLFTHAVADVTPVYNGNVLVSQVQREYLFIRPATFVVFDRVVAAQGVTRIFTLNLPGESTVHGDRAAFVDGAARLDLFRLAPYGAPMTLGGGRRLEVTDSAGTQSLFLHVLGTGGSVAGATRSDGGGTTGAQVLLADGRMALVRFGNTCAGGSSFELRDSDGTLQFSGPLPATVTPPPLFAD